jgi:hypothetical protein
MGPKRELSLVLNGTQMVVRRLNGGSDGKFDLGKNLRASDQANFEWQFR